MNENIIPNEDVMRLAEKEEPRFLNLLLKNLDYLADAVSNGIVASEQGKPGHFLISKNNFIYKLMFDNFHKYKTLLTRSAMDSLIDMQEIGTEEEKAAVKGYWDKIWNRSDASMEDYPLLKEHLNDRYILWQFYAKWKTGDQIIKAVANHGSLVEDFIRGLNGINNINPDNYTLVMPVEEGMKEAMKYIQDRRDHPENNPNIFCGIKAIDDILHGLARGSYTVVSGFVGGGKTTLMMNMSFNMAKTGHNVAYVSLEKDAKLFFRRILSNHAVTDYNRIKVGGREKFGLSDFWYEKLKDAARDLTENIKPHFNCLQFVQNTKLTKILNEVDKLRAIKKIDVLVVDYLQVIGFETNHPNRPDIDLADIHKNLMAYGKKHNIAVITALQLKNASSKDIRKKSEKIVGDSNISDVTVNTEDFSGSQMVVADADNALGVVLNNDKPATKMFVSFSKARDDESKKTVCLDYDGKTCRVNDPIRGSGQIKAVDELIYNAEITKESLTSEDNLFDELEKEAKETEETKETEEAGDSLPEDAEDTKDVEAPKEVQEEPKEIVQPSEKKEEVVVEDKPNSAETEVSSIDVEDLW